MCKIAQLHYNEKKNMYCIVSHESGYPRMQADYMCEKKADALAWKRRVREKQIGQLPIRIYYVRKYGNLPEYLQIEAEQFFCEKQLACGAGRK